jgi:hypothetical protein
MAVHGCVTASLQQQKCGRLILYGCRGHNGERSCQRWGNWISIACEVSGVSWYIYCVECYDTNHAACLHWSIAQGWYSKSAQCGGASGSARVPELLLQNDHYVLVCAANVHFVFVASLTMLIQYANLVGWKTNSKGFGRKWSWSDRTTAPLFAWKDWGKPDRTWGRIGVSVEIRTDHLLNMSPECYCYTNKFSQNLCTLLGRYQCFGGTYCFHLQGEK